MDAISKRESDEVTIASRYLKSPARLTPNSLPDIDYETRRMSSTSSYGKKRPRTPLDSEEQPGQDDKESKVSLPAKERAKPKEAAKKGAKKQQQENVAMKASTSTANPKAGLDSGSELSELTEEEGDAKGQDELELEEPDEEGEASADEEGAKGKGKAGVHGRGRVEPYDTDILDTTPAYTPHPPAVSSPPPTRPHHGALASPDPCDALSTPDVQSHLCCQLRCADPVSQRAALVSRRAFTLVGRPPFFYLLYFLRLAPTPLAPSESAPCTHMLRSAVADSERHLVAEAYALSRSCSTARSRARRLESPGCAPSPLPKKEIICTHLTEKSARQHVKARKGIPESVTQGALSSRAHVCKAALEKNASPRRLEHPRRVFGLRSRPRIDSHWRGMPSLQTLRTFDSLHASPARGVVACTLARSMRGLRTRSQQTGPATLARKLRAACTVSSRTGGGLYIRTAASRRLHSRASIRIGFTLLVGNARAVSII
ncbi:hypothetical protein C8J57DRAFT_1558088 [Mycena rebaudengoi]|nr:hypothetical protein C8J57DRAFT_1558088 [Mycena rebaudengoi]